MSLRWRSDAPESQKSLTQRLGTWWQSLPLNCSYCGSVIDGVSVSKGQSSIWCLTCRRVTVAPLLRLPSWITGVVGVLAVNCT